jgi:hypothetical protein
MRILFALLTLLSGGVLLAMGYRVARFIIPIWGFVAGLSVGGAVMSGLNSTPFLGTFLGVLVGLALGVLFGILAYMYYAIAIVVLIGSIGYWVGSSFITFLGFNPGVLSFIVGLALGILAAIVALIWNAPKYTLIVGTSIAGAMAVIGGILLLFNQIPLDYFSYSAVNHTVNNSFLWSIVSLGLAVFGIVVQSRSTTQYSFEAWTYHHNDGAMLPPTQHHSAGGVH